MEIKLIKTEADYEKALLRTKKIFDAKPSTKLGDELEILVTLIEKYEAKYYPMPDPDPIEAIKFVMEQNGMTDHDLGLLINSRSRVSEIFNKKRPLTLRQMRILHDKLKIPADVLIKEYELI